MPFKLAVSTALTVLVSLGTVGVTSVGWAQGGSARGSGKGKGGDEIAGQQEAIARQFQWEEKVVGPKDKGVDHRKIAAMQEQARREDAAKKKQPQPPKKVVRAEGIAAPASATLPTMDIEKAAPAGAGAHKTTRRAGAAQAEAPHRDALDALLAEEGRKPAAPASSSSSRGLGSVLAVGDTKAAPAEHAEHDARAARKAPPARAKHH
jgi:hypothetical protein